MTVYALLWKLIKHALHGRGRDEVGVGIDWDLPPSSGSIAGAARDFYWESDADAFCIILAVSEDGPRLDDEVPS